MKTAGGTVAGLVIGAAGGYYAGLGAQPGVTQPGVTQTVTQAQTVTQTVAKGGQKAKVAFLFSGPIDDLGWNMQHYQGLKYIADQGRETGYTELVLPPEVEKVARDYIALGYNFIIYGGGWAREGFLAVSKAFPDTAHVLVEGFEEDRGPNTQIVMDQSQQNGYIQGQVAAHLTKTKTIGWVIGMEVPDINLWTAGGLAGIRAVDPSIKRLYSVVGSFEDPAKGKEATLGMIEAGADVIIECGDGTSFGIVEAAKAHNVPVCSQWWGTPDYATGKGPSLIGNDLAAVGGYCNWAPAFWGAVQRFEEGKFGYRGDYPSFANGALKNVVNPNMRSDLVKLANDLAAKITSGEIAVPTASPSS
jgi:basic membrane lipoprotein Med (substrate-binding protein (PBP1-ABC) superfamily)